MRTIILSILSTILAFSSTVNPVSAQTYYEPLKSMTCFQKSPEFYLFYDGEDLPFEYEKLGEVTSIVNTSGFNNNDLLTNLKYYAWNNCANGLIFIKSAYSGAEGRKYYTALAVRIETNSDFKMKYGSGTDLSFVQKTKNTEVKIKNKRIGLGVFCIAGLLAQAYILFLW